MLVQKLVETKRLVRQMQARLNESETENRLLKELFAVSGVWHEEVPTSPTVFPQQRASQARASHPRPQYKQEPTNVESPPYAVVEAPLATDSAPANLYEDVQEETYVGGLLARAATVAASAPQPTVQATDQSSLARQMELQILKLAQKDLEDKRLRSRHSQR